MELVYLWVEKYKNIYKQGFNFSSRFECNYKHDANELTIDKNDDYISNFFGDNINVTAIVGKNGSGKSSIIEILSDIFGNCTEISSYKYILIYKYNNKYYLTTTMSDIRFPSFLKLMKLHYQDALLKIHFDTIVLKITNELQKRTFFDTKVIYQTEQLFELNTRYQNINNLKKLILKNYVCNKTNKVSQSFFEPNKFKLTILFNKLVADNELFKDGDKKKIDYCLKQAEDYCEQGKYIECFLKVLDLMDLKTKLIKKVNPTFPLRNQYSKNNYFYKKELREKSNLFSHDTCKISDTSNELIDFIFDLPDNYFAIELFENDIEFKDLSFGEQQLLSQLNYIIAKANLDTYDEYIPLETNAFTSVLVFLDEFELGLHPLWQKKVIDYIVGFLTQVKNKKFNFVITTHSPFLLSDIPKQNIIFLDTDDEGKCKVVDGLKEKKETFGANIHTLLSDSFFMEDGLMGEFAKSKINEIIDFHKEVEKENKKEQSNFTSLKIRYEEYKIKFWQVQSIIGEEYLKQVIKNHLRDIENILLGHNQAKEEEINRLREEADRLENMK